MANRNFPTVVEWVLALAALGDPFEEKVGKRRLSVAERPVERGDMIEQFDRVLGVRGVHDAGLDAQGASVAPERAVVDCIVLADPTQMKRYRAESLREHARYIWRNDGGPVTVDIGFEELADLEPGSKAAAAATAAASEDCAPGSFEYDFAERTAAEFLGPLQEAGRQAVLVAAGDVEREFRITAECWYFEPSVIPAGVAGEVFLTVLSGDQMLGEFSLLWHQLGAQYGSRTVPELRTFCFGALPLIADVLGHIAQAQPGLDSSPISLIDTVGLLRRLGFRDATERLRPGNVVALDQRR